MIPKPQYLNALLHEKLISLLVMRTLARETVAATVKFNRELCSRAIEIQKINAAGVLAAEFELAEPPVTQQTPEPFFGVGGFFAELTGEITGACSASAVFAVLRRATIDFFLLPC
jgi:hypothetical protein